MTEPAKKRRKLTPTEDDQVWVDYYGNTYFTKCYCCRKRTITPHTKENGHIIPHSKGGPSNEDNIIPICKDCNRAMGDRNLFEFQRNIYPFSY